MNPENANPQFVSISLIGGPLSGGTFAAGGSLERLELSVMVGGSEKIAAYSRSEKNRSQFVFSGYVSGSAVVGSPLYSNNADRASRSG